MIYSFFTCMYIVVSPILKETRSKLHHSLIRIIRRFWNHAFHSESLANSSQSDKSVVCSSSIYFSSFQVNFSAKVFLYFSSFHVVQNLLVTVLFCFYIEMITILFWVFLLIRWPESVDFVFSHFPVVRIIE